MQKRFQIGYQLLTSLLSGVGLFLSIWIVIPAPTLWLLPLGVGAPEISPILLVGNAIAFILSRKHSKRIRRFTLSFSLLGIVLSAIPLVQIPSTVAQATSAMQVALGANYLTKIPIQLQTKMRPHPFVLADMFTGIANSEVRRTSGLSFASPNGVNLTLEIYRPLALGKYPAIVTIYGGAWQRGSPLNDPDFNRYMAAQGYTVIAIDYRHAPRYRFPSQLQDVQAALAFIRNHALEYEIDSDRIAILGRSAGAHLAMLAAYQPEVPPIKAVVSYYGPVDLVKGYEEPPFPDPINSRAVLEAFLGGSPKQVGSLLYKQASPSNYVRSGLPPTLLVYGDRDHIVQSKFGYSLYKRLQAEGNVAVFLGIPWADHAFDALPSGISNQVALYYTERFLAWALAK